ncbi:MAG: hypothetical protein K0V04_22420 [Deltaproteobacteria bacterium]|nr:hypothetical protein [Deltaproteobacteria bacterium]
MAGFPLTAWAVRHPLGDDADRLLDALASPGAAAAPTSEPAAAVAEALFEEMAPHCARACQRWGASRVAVILGSAAPTAPEPLARLSVMLSLARRHTGITGPAYHVAATGAGGAKALASAERLLRASLADAVVVGGIDEGQGALLLLESHGEAFVRLRSSAEATGSTDAQRLDDAAARRAIDGAWTAARRPPLGYVHTHAAATEPLGEAEAEVVRALCGPIPHRATRSALHSVGAAAGAIDAVLAAACLARGYAPGPTPPELQHDRVLVHAFSSGGHHVALLLEARP